MRTKLLFLQIHKKETLLQSIFCDFITFFCLGFTFYFNYKFIDGNNFLDVIICICFIVGITKHNRISKKTITLEQLEEIEKITNKEKLYEN